MTQSLYVERRGSGQPIVFLHGLGASGRYWERLLPLLADDRAVVVPDLLGFGRSPKPSGARYDVDSHLAALRPLISEGCTVVGHSAGAVLAAAIGARYRDAVERVVLVGLPAYPTEAIASEEIGRLGLLARLTVSGSVWARVICETMCAVRPLAMAIGPMLIRDLPREVVRDGARHTWPSYSRTLTEVVVRHRVLPDLRDTRAPTLLLHGDSDREAPSRYVEAVAANDASVALVVIPDGDHHVAVRRADAVAAAIIRFLAGSRSLE